MDYIQRNLQATSSLLNALQKDPSLLKNEDFIKKLSILRLKHEETTNFLASRVDSDFRINSVMDRIGFQDTNSKNNNTPRKTFCSFHTRSSNLLKKSSRVEDSRKFGDTSTLIHIPTIRHDFASSSHVVEENFLDDGLSTTREIPTIVDEVAIPPKKQGSQVSAKTNLINDSRKSRKSTVIANTVRPAVRNAEFVPRNTKPVPFKFVQRKPIENTYAKKFISDLMEEKSRKTLEDEEELKKVKFKANPVPDSTYVPQNNYLNDEKYIASMRRKVAAIARRKFEQQSEMVRSKSEGNIASMKPVGYVPPSTYISPIPVKMNSRSRETNRRAVQLIQEANTPKGIKSHRAISNMAFRSRHTRCKIEKPVTVQYRRSSPPNFSRLHATMDQRIRRVSPKPSTIPVPFNFASRSPSASSRHLNCQEESIRKYKPRAHSAGVYRGTIASNNATRLREEWNRKKTSEEGRNEENVWKQENRRRIAKFLGSRSKTEEDIAIRTKQKIQVQQETTRDYMKQLAEMKQRVLNGPLIMEKQTALAQEHRLQKKFAERMRNAERDIKGVDLRRGSHESAGTFVVNYADDFENSSRESNRKDGSKSSSNSVGSKSSATSDSSSSSSSSNSSSSTPSSSSRSSKF